MLCRKFFVRSWTANWMGGRRVGRSLRTDRQYYSKARTTIFRGPGVRFLTCPYNVFVKTIHVFFITTQLKTKNLKYLLFMKILVLLRNIFTLKKI